MTPKGPILPFEIDPLTGRFERVEEPLETPAEKPELPIPLEKPRPWWRRPGLMALVAIVGIVLIQAVDYLTSLIERSPLLGWPFAALLGVAVFTAFAALWKEVFDIRRVRRAEKLRLTGTRRMSKTSFQSAAKAVNTATPRSAANGHPSRGDRSIRLVR
jgi:uncharacterized membrane protein YcjF (UPF0283 family)